MLLLWNLMPKKTAAAKTDGDDQVGQSFATVRSGLFNFKTPHSNLGHLTTTRPPSSTLL
jgi:hypothetical protein